VADVLALLSKLSDISAALFQMVEIYPFNNELSCEIWRKNYQYLSPSRVALESSIADSWTRVSAALGSVEPNHQDRWSRAFREILTDFRFLPAGRILAGAGTTYPRTLFNCFVMGFIEDSPEGVSDALEQCSITMQWGGGIGCDFSTLRPSGSSTPSDRVIAPGPVSTMQQWDAMCAALLTTTLRRGAMMGTLRCDHPEIEAFIDAKRQVGALTNFNLSVQVMDDFMEAVAGDLKWSLCFPMNTSHGGESGAVKRLRWPGSDGLVPCRIVKEVSARALWQRLMDAAYDTAEPGVLFIDRINQLNNLYYREHITSTNPCGEIPLPAYGACDLGSINLTQFVERPFTRQATLNLRAINETVRLATRFLDNVIDLSRYPFPEQGTQARDARRLGLGLTGLGDALLMLGLHYDSDAARAQATDALEAIRDGAYRAAIQLAREKGSFPAFDREAYLAGAYVTSLPADIRDGIARHGIRNSHLIAIAPTGSISLLANNISSGIEPVFALEAKRRILNRPGQFVTHDVVDYAFDLWRREWDDSGSIPDSFVTAQELSPEAHLQMQSALQPLVDNAISKTINVPKETSREVFASIYERAYRLGLKGCTVFRPNSVTGVILSSANTVLDSVHCCTLEREGD